MEGSQAKNLGGNTGEGGHGGEFVCGCGWGATHKRGTRFKFCHEGIELDIGQRGMKEQVLPSAIRRLFIKSEKAVVFVG